MSDLTDAFKELEAHAREWLDFSRETYGWNTREYGDHVRCYFADVGDYRTVHLGKYGCQIEINFHTPVQFAGLSYRSLANLDLILSDCRALLAEERTKAAQRTEAEVTTERAKQIETLRMRLAELEGGVTA